MGTHSSSSRPAREPSALRRVIVLGSTGSIGTQTLDVIEHLNRLADAGQSPTRFRVVGLATGRSAAALCAQAAGLNVTELALADEVGACDAPAGARVRRGADAAERLVREVECDLVLSAMVGSAGLPATLAAVQLGRDVALANKETLVAAGELVVPAALASGSRLLPVDSEHSAVWQCLLGCSQGEDACVPAMRALPAGVRRLVLTASGGPFRTWAADRIASATVEQALKHPTWTMGRKITIDSASLCNKALEVVEAHWLFGAAPEQIDVVVHPQSIVHSLVEFDDGAVLAQLGPSDMRGPIQLAMTFPHRPASPCKRLDLASLSRLEFESPDHERFPLLGLAYRVMRAGGTSGAVFNAANEAAVEAFLSGTRPGLSFGRMVALTLAAFEQVGSSPVRELADVLQADAEARRAVHLMLDGSASSASSAGSGGTTGSGSVRATGARIS